MLESRAAVCQQEQAAQPGRTCSRRAMLLEGVPRCTTIQKEQLLPKLHHFVYFLPDAREVYENEPVYLIQNSPKVIVLYVHKAYG